MSEHISTQPETDRLVQKRKAAHITELLEEKRTEMKTYDMTTDKIEGDLAAYREHLESYSDEEWRVYEQKQAQIQVLIDTRRHELENIVMFPLDGCDGNGGRQMTQDEIDAYITAYRHHLNGQTVETLLTLAKTTLNDLIGDATFRVFRYPELGDDNFVADEPRLSLVVLDMDQPATEDGLPKETEELCTRILKQHGKGFRKHANMLVFLAPDQQRTSEVIDAARRLLALRSIEDDKTTKKQLSEEQLKDLANRLKDAEARLPGALTTAYRFILVPGEKKTLRQPPFDLGISSYTGRTTLSSKVLEKLIDEGSLLDKLDPDFLVPTSTLGKRFGLWPEDQEIINVRTLADYFTQLTHLPRLHGAQVLPECFAKGVQRGLFGYALGDGDKKKFDTIYCGNKAITAADCEITESAWLLRPELAKSLMPKPEPAAVGTGGGTTTEDADDGAPQNDGWKGGGGAVKIVKGERRLDMVRLNLKSVPWENWNDIYNEVIDPLVKEGADLHCQVIIIAQGDAAIRENTVELGIKESLGQRGIDAEIQTK